MSVKGKERADLDHYDPEDLLPAITYRQLHSQTLGVRDPLRVIALCDSDAFYAACEMVRLGITDKPLVVLQWESLIAVNYPARKFGISRMDKLKDAKARCPELVVVHVATYKEGEKEPGYWDNVDTRTHKVSLDFYRRESAKIHGIFREMLPDAEVEKASIDEAFIDFTQPVRKLLLHRYPELAQPPPDELDNVLPPPPPIKWDGLGNIVPHDDTDDSESSPPNTWHDVAISIAAELMHKVREEVRIKLGYTLSAGIARNKFLAKLSASYRKPNSQNNLLNIAIPHYLEPMQFQKIRFLGGKLGDALAKEYDVSTVGDLLSVSLNDMQSKFGEGAIWIYEILRGIDRSEVKAKSSVNKSMLASKNLAQAITKAEEGYHWIRVLAAELALRLKDARETNPNLWPKTLVLHARHGYEASRSRQAPFPFRRDFDVSYIAGAGNKLWKELVGTATTMKVTSVQLAFTGVGAAESGQRSIEGFFKNGSSSSRNDDHVDEGLTGQVENAPATSSFTCPRCQKELRATALEDAEVNAALEAIKVEHGDWHFAQDLAKEDLSSTERPRLSLREPVKGSQALSPPKRKKKRKREDEEPKESIARFFVRR
ncbi:DNA polymerase eta [Cylindrobasidium torrendii FP15055 ss-10]|uniref:DNA polymerase eta n=1 Tax=Cylindrobasidium torrendii FP15055 ss-10 TaxID=1314674 RepID=A0A0D7B7K9_9AGAR|nr:DNA polymerase eta [Cylindrobasidium torrendii FP15055 ss-10]